MDRERPATVAVATILMSVTGLGYVIIALPLFGQAGRARERARELSGFADLDTGSMETLFSAATVLVAMLTIVVGVTLLGVSAAVRSGSQAGRIVAWVVMGLLLLCGLGGAARSGWPDFGGNVYATAWRSDGTGRQGISETLPDAYSTAYRVGSGIFATFAMTALIVAIVLLTRPSANRWFRPTPSPAGPPPGYHPAPYRQTGPFAAPPPSVHHGGPPPAPLRSEGPQPAPVRHDGPQPPGRAGGPSWSRPVEGPLSARSRAVAGWSDGPGSTRPPKQRAEVDAELAVLVRRHQRGEITDAEYAAARTRLTGS